MAKLEQTQFIVSKGPNRERTLKWGSLGDQRLTHSKGPGMWGELSTSCSPSCFLPNSPLGGGHKPYTMCIFSLPNTLEIRRTLIFLTGPTRTHSQCQEHCLWASLHPITMLTIWHMLPETGCGSMATKQNQLLFNTFHFLMRDWYSEEKSLTLALGQNG